MMHINKHKSTTYHINSLELIRMLRFFGYEIQDDVKITLTEGVTGVYQISLSFYSEFESKPEGLEQKIKFKEYERDLKKEGEIT